MSKISSAKISQKSQNRNYSFMKTHTKKAVIDLGTNTFHLLIVEPDGVGHFKEIYRKRIFVQLAEDSITHIGKSAFERGLNALREYKMVLDEYGIEEVKAFGTAALRRASNSAEFRATILQETGIEIQVIAGNEEARLITEGVRLAVPVDEKPVLIMDIGGGSVEFIIANDREVFWAQSFPVGVAVLYNDFHKSEPISEKEIKEVRQFLEHQLSPLKEALLQHPVAALVGASGTFDVLEAMLVKVKDSPLHACIEAKDFYPIYDRIVSVSLDERLKINKLPTQRAELIVVALILIHYVLGEINIEKIIVSMYAMKEGMLSELIHK